MKTRMRFHNVLLHVKHRYQLKSKGEKKKLYKENVWFYLLVVFLVLFFFFPVCNNQANSSDLRVLSHFL